MRKRGFMTNGKSLGWGLIGASTIAKEWMVDAINAQTASHVVGVMSQSQERADQYASDNNIPNAYDNLDDLLTHPDIDVVYISTTNDRHFDETLVSANAGKHILCEKPLALTLEDAKTMKRACEKAGVVMGTNHHLRNAATHRKIRELIADGAVGDVLAGRVFHAVFLPPHLQGWRINQPNAGGVILDITVHDTDTLRFLLNDEVQSVTALSASQGMAEGDVEDAVMGVMQFSKGAIVQFHDAFTIKHAHTGLEIHGTEGSIFGENIMTQQPIGTLSLRRGDTIEKIDSVQHENLYERSVRLFNTAVQGTGEPAATADDGIRSLAVALAVVESTRTKQHITVNYG
jgi:1,5-anhydro-D-fructose reductase (1,5-anhydro-D-mannitol-forming)